MAAQADKKATLKIAIAAVCLLVAAVLIAMNTGLLGGAPGSAAEANLKPATGPSDLVKTLPPEQQKEIEEYRAEVEERERKTAPAGS